MFISPGEQDVGFECMMAYVWRTYRLLSSDSAPTFLPTAPRIERNGLASAWLAAIDHDYGYDEEGEARYKQVFTIL